MDSSSLKHEAGIGQLDSSLPEMPSSDSSASDEPCDTFQEARFSLTFSAPEWGQLWRLLNVGCMLSDELLILVNKPHVAGEPDSALLWNQLSTELADQLKQGVIKVTRENVTVKKAD